MAMFANRRPTFSDRPFGFEGAQPIAPMPGEIPSMSPPLPAQKSAFFGQGGTGRQIVGILGDALSAAGGGQPFYGPAMMRRREQERMFQQRMTMDQMGREQDWQKWVAQQAWQRANPAPTAFERDLTAAGIDPASEQGRGLYQRRVTNMADPIQAVPTMDDQGRQGLTFIRPSQMGSQPAAPAALSADEGGRILEGAASSRTLSADDAERVRQSLGAGGQAQFDAWRQKHGIMIQKSVGGKTYYQTPDGRWFDNPEGR